MLRSKSLYLAAKDGERLEDALGQAFDLPRGLPSAGTDTVRTSEIDPDDESHVQRGVTSGILSLDLVCPGGGYYVAEPSLVVASRGGGKTAWMVNSCVAGARAGHKAGYATLEMPAAKIVRRMVQSICGWSHRPGLSGKLQAEYDRAKQAVRDLDIPIYDPSGRAGGDRTVEGLVAWAVDLKSTRGLDCLYVDYVQKLSSSARRFDNRTRELDHVADELEWLAKRAGVAIVQGSQLTADPTGKGLGRAKDSIRFEDNAALVLQPKRDKEGDGARVTVTKNRHGEEPSLPLKWNRMHVRYEDEGGAYDPYADND